MLMWIPAIFAKSGLWPCKHLGGSAESAGAIFFRVPFESSTWGSLGGFVSHTCKVTRNPRRQTAKIHTGASLAGRQEESSISVKQSNKHLTFATTLSYSYRNVFFHVSQSVSSHACCRTLENHLPCGLLRWQFKSITIWLSTTRNCLPH